MISNSNKVYYYCYGFRVVNEIRNKLNNDLTMITGGVFKI